MEKLLLDNLWPEIKRLSRKSSRTDAAIAYFTSDKFLKLKAGDTLIVNASTQAIQTGGTSAKLLWKLRHDVRLFNLPSLHAKIILFDDQVMVGSANASETSANDLDEAGVLTNSPQVISQARSFLYQLSRKAEGLTEEKLRKFLKINVRRPGKVSGIRKPRIAAPGDRIWIVSTRDLDEGKFAHEENAVAQAERRIQKTHPKAEPNWIRWTGKSRFRERAKQGDNLIVFSVTKTNGKTATSAEPTPRRTSTRLERSSRNPFSLTSPITRTRRLNSGQQLLEVLGSAPFELCGRRCPILTMT